MKFEQISFTTFLSLSISVNVHDNKSIWSSITWSSENSSFLHYVGIHQKFDILIYFESSTRLAFRLLEFMFLSRFCFHFVSCFGGFSMLSRFRLRSFNSLSCSIKRRNWGRRKDFDLFMFKMFSWNFFFKVKIHLDGKVTKKSNKIQNLQKPYFSKMTNNN